MKTERKLQRRVTAGSALILTVVLTTMLAIIGVMFLMSARIDRMASSNVAENKELDFAVETAVARISKDLARDADVTLSATATGADVSPYYDYPDQKNRWLASLEPYNNGGVYKWQQVSDVTGYLANNNITATNLSLQSSSDAIVGDHDVIMLNTSGITTNVLADADGDGVGDSKWIELDPCTVTTKGKHIYAAIRVIDNGGMLNVNTAYSFSPTSNYIDRVDGSSQMQINLAAMRKGTDTIGTLGEARYDPNNITFDWRRYQSAAIWSSTPQPPARPFDLSDELDLRNRFLLDLNNQESRIEAAWRTLRYPWHINRFEPIIDSAGLTSWNKMMQPDTVVPPIYDYDTRHLLTTYNAERLPDQNLNRLNSSNALGLFTSIKNALRSQPNVKIKAGSRDINDIAAQLAVNLIDYTKPPEQRVTELTVGTRKYYGFKQPVVYISELAESYDPNSSGTQVANQSFGIEIYNPYGDRLDNTTRDWRLVIDNNSALSAEKNSPFYFKWSGSSQYNVILFKSKGGASFRDLTFKDSGFPSPTDGAAGVATNLPLQWDPTGGPYDVFLAGDPNQPDPNNPSVSQALTNVEKRDSSTLMQTGLPANSLQLNLQPNFTYYWAVDGPNSPGTVNTFTTGTGNAVPDEPLGQIGAGRIIFADNSIIKLERRTSSGGWVTVDYIQIPLNAGFSGLSSTQHVEVTFQRDLTQHNLMRGVYETIGVSPLYDKSMGIWDSAAGGTPTLGHINSYASNDVKVIQAHPLGSKGYTNVGEIGMLFIKGTYWSSFMDDMGIVIPPSTLSNPMVIRSTDDEKDMRLNLEDPFYHVLFQILRAFPRRGGTGSAVVQVQGRINVNTAPWYVIAQLPWVSDRGTNYTPADRYALAKAIVAYRDMQNVGTVNYSNRLTGLVSRIPVDKQKNSNLTLSTPGQTNGDVREDRGFASIGELNLVIDGADDCNIAYYKNTLTHPLTAAGYPDLTPNDGAKKDFEKRDLIFARISNLVTVKSDTFTAYILVRVGTDGPQKRVIAILDRSGVTSASGKPKVIALHPVPDPH